MKKFFPTLLATVMLLCAGCSDNNGNSNAGNTGNGEVNVKVWSTNALEKVQRDTEYGVETPATLNFEMAKNEVEGAQFIISNIGEYKANEFTVEMSKLTNGAGNEIPASAVKVYLQKYLNITQKVSKDPTVQGGYTPDPLLPFDKAVEYDENKVEGVNQGVYITVETQPDTVAGTYSGTCLVTVDGKEFSIPTNVTVWDFAISEETHIRSLFCLWPEENMGNELDSTKEMYEKYYEFLAQYRISGNVLPEAYDTPEEYAENAKKAYDDPRITAFSLPYTGYAMNLDTAYMKSFVLALVRASEKDGELLEKAVYYLGGLDDEPQYTNRFADAKKYDEDIAAMKEEVISDLEMEGFFTGKSEEVVNSIKAKVRAIPHIVTIDYQATQELDEPWDYDDVTYCPIFDRFSDNGPWDIIEPGTTNVDSYKKIKEEGTGELWWYGCSGPYYPWPSYHLDSSLVGARVIGIMQYDYNIDGNLYWCVNRSSKGVGSYGDITKYADPYEDASKNSLMTPGVYPANGDGWLMYPGVDYGIDGPVGSLRLEAIRDGNEDYEYLYLLEQLTEGLSEYYNEEITVDNMVSNLYDKIYSDAQCKATAADFSQVRREIAEVITTCNSDSKYVFNGLTYANNNAYIEFFAASDYTVKVNGAALTGVSQGLGLKYSASVALDKSSNGFVIELSKNGKTITFNVDAGGKMATISNFNEADSISILAPNDDNVVVTYNENSSYATSGGSLKAVITSKFNPDNPLATLLYNPQLSLDIKASGLDIVNLDAVVCNIYNAGDEAIDMRIRLVAKTGDYLAQSITLQKGWNTVKLSGIYAISWKSLPNTEKIVFEFNNSKYNKNEEAMPEQVVYFDELVYSEISH